MDRSHIDDIKEKTDKKVNRECIFICGIISLIYFSFLGSVVYLINNEDDSSSSF